MPKPPILPKIDWNAVFESGLEYADWLKQAENPDHVNHIKTRQSELDVPPHMAAMLAGLGRAVHVVAIAEDWCGDVVRHVPVLQRLADHAPYLHIRYISREQHPDVFVRFLTNGGEAIPKFIFLSDRFVECGNWGPMTAACREIISRGKACGDVGSARAKVSKLYEAHADGQDVMCELLHLIDIAASVAP